MWMVPCQVRIRTRRTSSGDGGGRKEGRKEALEGGSG